MRRVVLIRPDVSISVPMFAVGTVGLLLIATALVLRFAVAPTLEPVTPLLAAGAVLSSVFPWNIRTSPRFRTIAGAATVLQVAAAVVLGITWIAR